MEWRIFFIGPMQSTGSSADHFSQMVDAVAAELQEHGYQAAADRPYQLTGGTTVNSRILMRVSDQDEITLIQPHDLFLPRSIPENVFDAIDDADLVIADLSRVRPAVVYELAFAHALGIWTILLGSQSDRARMFYLGSYRHTLVDFSMTDIRTPEFKGAIRTWLGARNKRFNSKNPFTDFYGAPLPDISAALGLATGYYENFLRRVLATDAEIVDKSKSMRRKVSGVIVVKPSGLDKFIDVFRMTETLLKEEFPDYFRRGEKGEVYVETGGDHGDRTCEFVVGPWLIDIPRTVLTLERSPRLRRTNSHRAGELVYHRAHDHLAEVLIERFLENAKWALEDDEEIANVEERFFYGTPDQIVEFLEQQIAEHPSVWEG